MSEPADKPVPEPGDPNYILSQAEFHQQIGGLQGAISREFDGLRKTGGWLFISLGLWALLIGFTIVTGNEKGRRG